MGTTNNHRARLHRQSILLFGCIILFGHFASRAGTLQSFQASLDGNPSLALSEKHQGTPPKSSIEISSPDRGTVWTVSEPAQIEWETENIGTAKSIRFFLAKDDMVVQELGSFKNNSFAEGIELAKNVGSGDNYQVVGIELFPDNKFQVAKYASPYFSIRNPEADARKAAALDKRNRQQKQVVEVTSHKSQKRKKREKKEKRVSAEKNAAPVASNNATPEDSNMAITDEFKGRKISYIKELSFANDEVSINLWDHGRQDGDIVSIYLNGKSIVAKHLLTYRKKNIRFKLDASRSNELFLYAHNLGKAPPNTVSIELTDGTTSEKIVLNSDLKSCEAVQIKVDR